MMRTPAAIASGSCQTRSSRPMVEAPAPSATKTVVKPSTKANEVTSRALRAPDLDRRASPSARKSSTDTPAM